MRPRLRIPPVSSSRSTASTRSVKPLSIASALITPSASSNAVQGPSSAVPTQNQNQASQLGTAIGAGIGVPLGIAAVGFLGFMFWREARRAGTEKHRVLRESSFAENTVNGDRSVGELDGAAKNIELPHTLSHGELDGEGRNTELPIA